MYSAFPGYSGPQPPTLNRYYHPSSSSPPDPEELARRQRREDKKRQLLFARLKQQNADESSSSSGSDSPVVVRVPSVISADSISLHSTPTSVETDREWLESTESCHACSPLQCNEHCATREEHDDFQHAYYFGYWTRRGHPPPMPRPYPKPFLKRRTPYKNGPPKIPPAECSDEYLHD